MRVRELERGTLTAISQAGNGVGRWISNCGCSENIAKVPHEKTDNVNHLLGIRAQTRKRRCAWIIRGNFTTETELVGAGTIIAGTLSRRHRDFPFHPSQNVDRDKIVVKPKTIR